MSELDRLEKPIAGASPALWAALSPLGRRVEFPPGIPFQAGEARAMRFNGTIGQVTDGERGPLALPAIEAALALPGEARDRAPVKAADSPELVARVERGVGECRASG